MWSSSNKLVGYTKLFVYRIIWWKFVCNSHTELIRINSNWNGHISSAIIKSNVMSKNINKIIGKENMNTFQEQGIFKKWRSLMTICCLKKIYIIMTMTATWQWTWRCRWKYKNIRREMFCKKGVLGKFAKFTGRRLCQSLFFNKVTDLMPATLKKRSWHRCFPLNFVKFLRIPFLQNTSGGCFWKQFWQIRDNKNLKNWPIKSSVRVLLFLLNRWDDRSKVFGVKVTPSSVIVPFHGWFCSFLTCGFFTIFQYITYQTQLSPCHRKTLVLALYSNHCMKTIKIKIQWNKNHLNSI